MTDLVVSPRLAELESTIERGLATFVEVGNALREVRDSELYKTDLGFDSFEHYCEDRWQLSRRRAYQLMDGAEAKVALCTTVHTDGPANEAQARELVPLKDKPDDLAAVWAEVSTGNGKPTAERIREVVQRLTSSETRPPPEYVLCPTCGHRLRKDQPRPVTSGGT